MTRTIAKNGGRLSVAFAALLLGLAVPVFAQQMKYEGDIVALDGKANTFTVKGSKPGEVTEMAFRVSPESLMLIEGEPGLFGELVKGDHVVVTYQSTGDVHTVNRAERTRSAARELSFTGSIMGVDAKAQMFTVKSTTGGHVQEMEFHVNPAARLYIGSEQVLLSQLRPGETVTVEYEANDSGHFAKRLKKTA